MLTIVDTSTFSSYFTLSYQAGTFCCYVCQSLPAMTLGVKPKAGPENYFGNRDVDHINFSGHIFPKGGLVTARPYYSPVYDLDTGKVVTTYSAPVKPIYGTSGDLVAMLCYPWAGFQRLGFYANGNNQNGSAFATLCGESTVTFCCCELSAHNDYVYVRIHLGVFEFQLSDGDAVVNLAPSWDTTYIPPLMSLNNRPIGKLIRRTPNGDHGLYGYEWVFRSYYGATYVTERECSSLCLGFASDFVMAPSLWWNTSTQPIIRRKFYPLGTFNSRGQIDPVITKKRIRYFKHRLISIAKDLLSDVPVDELAFGDATALAVEKARAFTGNGIAYAAEMKDLAETIEQLMSLLRGNVSPTALANLWLSYRYGLRLTLQDSREICHGLAMAYTRETRYGYAVARGKAPGRNARCILYYALAPQTRLFRTLKYLMDWDILPAMTNLWDLIPFSFVLDWFVDIESVASAIDTRTYLNLCEVVSALYTNYGVYVPKSTVFCGYEGTLKIKRFWRKTYGTPFEPQPTLSGSLPSFTNVIDGASLLISSIK